MNPVTKEKTVDLSLNKAVFFIPWVLLLLMLAASLLNGELFLTVINEITGWILNNFAWMFNGTVLCCVVTVVAVFFSPLAKVRIGGRQAKPDMNYLNLVWITLCTTIAAGILFWACAEPMYQMFFPAAMEGAEPASPKAAVFAMKAMFLEWTWSPYAIYSVATLTFAFVFFNMGQSYSIGSALTPLFGDRVKKYSRAIDVICLFSLVAGVAAALGTGTLTLAGGVERIWGIPSTPVSWGIIILVITATFVISSITGVTKGIRLLSSINAKAYLILFVFLFAFGPTAYMLNLTSESWGAYLSDFFRMSLATGDVFQDGWAKSWPIFYWCNWLAWTPISAVFLGRILKGYTVRDGIYVNFIIPSVFSTIWMGLFSTTTIYYELDGRGMHQALLEKGPESVVYAVFDQLPLPMIVIPFYLFIVFISFVTASDSNTTAMAGLCTNGISSSELEAPFWLKIIWGATIGGVTWILIRSAGIDGIKAASNLGGFPNMFIMLLFIASLWKIMRNPAKYDIHKEDYLPDGTPIESPRKNVTENNRQTSRHGA